MNTKQLGQKNDGFELNLTELFEPSVVPTKDDSPLVANQLFAHVVRQFDSFLRRQQNVFEFCSHSHCLLRLALRRAADIDLPCQFSSSRGALVGELHLWNEHIPPLSASDSRFAWVMQLRRQMQESFALLAASVRADPHLNEIELFYAKTQLGANKQRTHFERLVKSFGFEDIEELSYADADMLGQWMYLGDCIYLWILARAFSPVLPRHPRPIRLPFRRLWMSRETLLKKYPPAPRIFSEEKILINIAQSSHSINASTPPQNALA